MTSIFDNIEEIVPMKVVTIKDLIKFWREGDLTVEKVSNTVSILKGFNISKLSGFRQLFWRIDQVTDGEEEFNSVLDKLIEVIKDPKFPEHIRAEHVHVINKEISKDLNGRVTAISKSSFYNLDQCYHFIIEKHLGAARKRSKRPNPYANETWGDLV
jgi:hypothetical protein